MSDTTLETETNVRRGRHEPSRRLRARARRLRVNLWGVSGLVCLGVVWYAASYAIGTSSLPTPWAVGQAMWENFAHDPILITYGLSDTGLGSALWFTMTSVFIAVGMGTGIGVVLGLLSARVVAMRAVINPIVATVGAVPVLIAAPFFLIWFGAARWSSVLLVTLYTAVILIIYSQRAARNLDPIYEDSARAQGASRTEILTKIVFPASIPEVVGGFRIALAGAWGLEAVAELLGLPRGIGQVISVLGTGFDVLGILAAIVTLGISAVVIDGVIVLLVNRGLPWRAAWR